MLFLGVAVLCPPILVCSDLEPVKVLSVIRSLVSLLFLPVSDNLVNVLFEPIRSATDLFEPALPIRFEDLVILDLEAFAVG